MRLAEFILMKRSQYCSLMAPFLEHCLTKFRIYAFLHQSSGPGAHLPGAFDRVAWCDFHGGPKAREFALARVFFQWPLALNLLYYCVIKVLCADRGT